MAWTKGANRKKSWKFDARMGSDVHIMAIRVVEFSNKGYKVKKIFTYESTHQRKLLNFEF